MRMFFDFDIDKAKTGDYDIVTNDDLPARIICWDKEDGDFCIVALIKDKAGYEFVQSYDEKGCARESDHYLDLRLALDCDVTSYDQLSEFEYVLGSYIWSEAILRENDPVIFVKLKEIASELRELVEPEFVNHKAFYEAYNSEVDILEKHITEEGISSVLSYILTEKGYVWQKPADATSLLRDTLDIALGGHWHKSDKTGISGQRYSLQGNTIYDCVAGQDVYCNDVLNIVIEALNYRGKVKNPISIEDVENRVVGDCPYKKR